LEEDPSHVRVQAEGTGEDKGIITITRNLDVALRHLRSNNQARLIWIDALCINQSDNHEKSLQVAMMGKIYSHADCVIAWLGPEKDNSNEALDLMQQWSQQVDVDWRNHRLHPSKQTTELTWSDRNTHLPYQNGELDPVFMLLARPYFERTWIRQEILLATRASIQCGQKHFTLHDFRNAVACLRMKGWFTAATTGSHLLQVVDNAFQLVSMFNFRFNLAKVREVLRGTNCDDARDRLYAVLSLLCTEDQELRIKADYFQTVEEIYTDVTRSCIKEHRHLDLFQSCELETKALNIPSWVPDWSSRINTARSSFSNWSACAWISAQAVFINDATVRVAGVNAARIEQVTEHELEEDSSYDDILCVLRSLRPPSYTQVGQETSDYYQVARYCRCLIGDDLRDDYLPPRDDRVDLTKTMQNLEYMWSSEATWNELFPEQDFNAVMFVSRCMVQLEGRCFVTASDGFFGLAPTGTQRDDVICVLLGCEFPTVLRPLKSTWQVVGICNVPGLMNGETIYGNQIPSQYRPVEHTAGSDTWIDGWPHGMYDPETATLKTNPAEVLQEAEIKVESYQRKPHRLEVLPETLIAAGVALEHFDLV
jgi:hypothetical protein